jgi:predicted site-specific integrase-resolvase
LKHLPLLLRPKQLCELFGINLKTLHRLETSGRVKAVRIGPRQVQRRYSPVAVAKSLRRGSDGRELHPARRDELHQGTG